MADNNQNQTNTSTQIRNLYSEGMAYLNISFYNTNLSFKFYPYMNMDTNGKSVYDLKNGLNTTVNFQGAFALWKTSKDILDGKIEECELPIPCAAGAELKLERKMGPTGSMDTTFSISKNGRLVVFKFETMTMQVTESGIQTTKTIETGLGAFNKTVDGYLTGINADRHLDKLTKDFVDSKNGSNQNNGNSGQYQNRNNGGGYRKYNNGNNGGYNNNNYRKYNNNGYGNNNNSGGYNPPQQQNMSSYRLN